MKKRSIIGITIALTLLLVSVFPAGAAKPDGSDGTKDVIAMSNGFPSGEHYNLNIHGKKADFVGDSTPGGNSVFILEYGESTIEYITNRKASLDTLYVLDPLAEYFDGNPARVQLPYEADGYFVFGRILAKPNNGSGDNESSIILYPNQVIGAFNDTGDPDFGSYTGDEEALLNLGLIVGSNLYTAEQEGYVRFDFATTKGKGYSKATDITDLFTYTGWIVDPILDVNDNGFIDIGDVPEGYEVPLGDYDENAATEDNRDFNNDGTFDDADKIESWLTDNIGTKAWYYENEWILNIADLVITKQGLVNDGTKLLQIRFYPVDSTQLTP